MKSKYQSAERVMTCSLFPGNPGDCILGRWRQGGTANASEYMHEFWVSVCWIQKHESRVIKLGLDAGSFQIRLLDLTFLSLGQDPDLLRNHPEMKEILPRDREK